ncbi:hypothetical protein GH714_020031 [Hevea brasiliensis]|uniref:Sucrose phosphatase-like domain-containing protein n=1 Tax=Hevea brasiliensis TaxID=3981 RepID=A0A6A6L738_HEVBR|nr:hypothetical protein GH714_020031 [Hevea brasiliensis]
MLFVIAADCYDWYRWPGENVRSMAIRLAKLEDGAEDDVLEYVQTSGSRSYSYIIKPGAKTRKVDEIRQRLRMRGFRCNLVYTRAASRLNVIPLFASRKQALRYLSVKWGIDLSKTFVFVGEKGDTDYEELLAGLHKTIIMRGSWGMEVRSFFAVKTALKEKILSPKKALA